MCDLTIDVTLVSPSGGYGDRESQEGLRAFNEAVSQVGAKRSIGIFTVDSAAADAALFLLTGSFGVSLAKHTLPAIAAAVGEWLVAREGATARIKIDGVEVEAKTAADAERLLKAALEQVPPEVTDE